MTITCKCDKCGKSYKVSETFAGKRAVCKACGSTFAIPSAKQAPLAPAKPKPEPRSTGFSLQDMANLQGGEVVAPSAPLPQSGPCQCPTCGKDAAPGAVICVHCGYNFQTGARISTQMDAPASRPARVSSAPAKSSARARREDEAACRGGWNSWALTFSMFAIGAPLLPALAGRQFVLLMVFGDFAPFMGIPCAIIAAIMWFNRDQKIWGAGTIAGAIAALLVAFSVGAKAPAKDTMSPTATDAPASLVPKAKAPSQLKADIDAGKARVSALETEIKQMQSNLQSLDAQLTSKRMLAQMPVMAIGANRQAEEARHQQAVNEYNSMLQQAKTLDAQISAKVTVYEQERNAVNAKVARYNSGER